jgi:hypothetical protein
MPPANKRRLSGGGAQGLLPIILASTGPFASVLGNEDKLEVAASNMRLLVDACCALA